MTVPMRAQESGLEGGWGLSLPLALPVLMSHPGVPQWWDCVSPKQGEAALSPQSLPSLTLTRVHRGWWGTAEDKGTWEGQGGKSRSDAKAA